MISNARGRPGEGAGGDQPGVVVDYNYHSDGGVGGDGSADSSGDGKPTEFL